MNISTENGERRSEDDLDVLTTVISALKRLDEEGQRRTLEAVTTFLNLSSKTYSKSVLIPSLSGESGAIAGPSFTEDRTISPKEFLLEKIPKTDVHRVTCLAYYLTHYRGTPHFKTIDISKLNTEAAQPKFANAAKAVNNATTAGYLVPATKGNKQLGAMGERFVQALPNMDAARSISSSVRTKRKTKKMADKKDV